MTDLYLKLKSPAQLTNVDTEPTVNGVKVKWDVQIEVDNLKVSVYRQKATDSGGANIPADFNNSVFVGDTQVNNYYIDNTVDSKTAYYYWLQPDNIYSTDIGTIQGPFNTTTGAIEEKDLSDDLITPDYGFIDDQDYLIGEESYTQYMPPLSDGSSSYSKDEYGNIGTTPGPGANDTGYVFVRNAPSGSALSVTMTHKLRLPVWVWGNETSTSAFNEIKVRFVVSKRSTTASSTFNWTYVASSPEYDQFRVINDGNRGSNSGTITDWTEEVSWSYSDVVGSSGFDYKVDVKLVRLGYGSAGISGTSDLRTWTIL